MDTKFCIHCGKKIPKDDMFCPYCGTKQANMNNDSNNTNNQDKRVDLSAEISRTNFGTSANQSTNEYQDTGTNQNSYQNNSQPNYQDNYSTDNDQGYNQQQNYQQQPNNQNAYAYQQGDNGLTPPEQNFVDQYVNNHSRHMLPAYLLLLVFVCATHFYLHQNAAGVVFILIQITDFFGVGLFIDLIWILVDLICIPFWVHNKKARAKKQAISVVMMNRQNQTGVNVNVN